MRILFITEEYPPLEEGCGGVASYVASIASMLARRGHEVHVLSCMRKQFHRDYFDRGVAIHRRSFVTIPGLRQLKRILNVPMTFEVFQSGVSNFLAYRRLGLEFDVIEYPDVGAEGWMFALRHHIPLVAHLHLPIPIWLPPEEIEENPLDFRWTSFLERFAIRRADVVTSPSKLLVKRLRDLKWLQDRNPEIISQFIHWPDWCHTRSIRESPPTVLFLSWLGKNKAPEVLVEAVAIVRKKLPEANAVFAGGSFGTREGFQYVDWIKKTATDLSGCQFVGYVPHQEVIHRISSCRVLAMPSWFENYPIAALEAMAGGRPVIVTETTGIADFIRTEKAGSIIPPGDAEALADALLPYLQDSSYAAEVGANAQRAIRKHLAPQNIVEQREVAYQQAIDGFHSNKGSRVCGMPLWTQEKG